MNVTSIAEEVLRAVGGPGNVTANDVCMTRLRILIQDPDIVSYERLGSATGVLGIGRRGARGIEVVFGPGRAEAVLDSIVGMTGIEATGSIFDSIDPDPGAPMRVSINNALQSAAAYSAGDPAATGDLSPCEDLPWPADEGDDWPADADPAQDADDFDDDARRSSSVLVINGPNINMLGIREPAIYGSENYQTLISLCHEAAREAGFSECVCFQSNHEGDLVDQIQDAYGLFDGIVINPGAYTHTSIALLDAAKAVSIPMVEVHISNVSEREGFRQVSYIREACFETITGMGIEGYRKAIADLALRLGL